MNRNKGFSMVEVIIVVVIIGIVSTGVMIGLSSVNRNNTDEGFTALASSIDTARYKTLSSENTSLYLYTDDGYYYSCIYNGTTKEKITEKLFSCNIPVYVADKTRNISVTVDKDHYIDWVEGEDFVPVMKLTFDKSTGQMKELITPSGSFSNQTLELYSDNGNKKLCIYKNGRTKVE